MEYYADVHRNTRNGEGFRITYTSDGASFMLADGFDEVPARSGDRVFVDTIPLSHTDEVIGMLGRGVEVYYLRRLTLIARRREELRLPKTARGDIRALMSIEQKWFRRVTEDFLVMRRMVVAYRSLMRARQQLLNKSKALTDLERYVVKPAIKALEQQMEELAMRIVEEAGRRYPAYNRLVEELGIDSNLTAMEALAEVLVFPEWCSWRRTKNYFGLWKRDRRTHYHKSKTARLALERLAMSIRGRNIKGKDLGDVLKTLWLAQKAGPPA